MDKVGLGFDLIDSFSFCLTKFAGLDPTDEGPGELIIFRRAAGVIRDF